MMTYLIGPTSGAVNVKNLNAKKIIVNVILGIKSVQHFANVMDVKTKEKLPKLKRN